MPQKTWAVGEEVLAADFNTYAQNQVVPTFTGTTQRDAQWPAPPTGALCVTTDTNTVWQRFASAWQALGFAGKRLASITVTAPQLIANSNASFGTTAIVSNVPIIGGRRTKVSFSAQGMTSTAQQDVFECRILEDNTTIVAIQTVNIPFANGWTPCALMTERVNLAAGNHSWQITLSRFSGTGTGGWSAAATAPATLLVEDLGPT